MTEINKLHSLHPRVKCDRCRFIHYLNDRISSIARDGSLKRSCCPKCLCETYTLKPFRQKIKTSKYKVVIKTVTLDIKSCSGCPFCEEVRDHGAT